jgi:hypothetical protein
MTCPAHLSLLSLQTGFTSSNKRGNVHL